MKLFQTFSFAAMLAAAALTAHAEGWVKYTATPSSKLKIDGTSTIHDWTIETKIIGGTMELESSFPLDPASAAEMKVAPKVDVTIPVRSLKSGKSSMDAVMQEAMKEPENPKIKYVLKEMTPKAGRTAGQPLEFNAKGELTVSGVTKPNEMLVTMEKNGDTGIKVIGTSKIKMTDFGITPPAPKVALGLITTGDEVTISFEWITKKAETN